LLDRALEAARNLPNEAQDDIARVILQLAARLSFIVMRGLVPRIHESCRSKEPLDTRGSRPSLAQERPGMTMKEVNAVGRLVFVADKV
jgi:hypothetical protein